MEAMQAIAAPKTGADLRAVRLKADVSVVDVARHVGVGRQRIHTIETSARPSPYSIERYLAALEALAV